MDVAVPLALLIVAVAGFGSVGPRRHDARRP